MKDLKQLLKTYIQKNPYELNAIKMLNFFNNHDGCFEKDNLPGHFTGSAWVISPDKNKILMIYANGKEKKFSFLAQKDLE